MSRPGHGNSGLHAARFTWSASGAHDGLLLETSLTLTADSWLSYCLFPEDGPKEDPDAATFASLDLLFDDGTCLSQAGTVDANGVPLAPEHQGAARILQPRQWNLVDCHIGREHAGRVVVAVLLRVDATAGGTVWVDDLSIADKDPSPVEPVDLVDTRRGSNSAFAFSRGNTFPATAVPNAATMVSPATRRSLDFFYSWAAHNTDEGLCPFEGLVLTHQPSPWMGDRNQLLISPSWRTANSSGPETFSHEDEDARPYRYRVELTSGLVLEAAPATNGAIVTFTPPREAGELIVELGVAAGEIVLRREGELWLGWLENGSGLSIGRSRQYVALTFSAVPVATSGGRFVFQGDTPVTARIAESLLGSSAAIAHLAEQLDVSLDELAASARTLWADRLAVLELPEAGIDERVSAYGSLYRLNLYPNFTGEMLGDDTSYASPVLQPAGPSDDTATGAAVRPGQMAVNHGFWDTYRTAWPAYALLYPELAARLADGFVEQYRTAGWIARWSSPGYADLMTGTSSDVAFADLDAKRVPLPDRMSTYLSGLRNATAAPTEPGVGRKDLAYRFRGAPSPECHEPVSWAFEASLNDHALGLMASRLLAGPVSPATARRLRDESKYLLVRSASYRNLYDEATGFFQSRHFDGTFRRSAAEYDPRVWGYDYTEANGWAFAFPAPHDPAGLAGLLGGRDRLLDRLDEFFATPESGDQSGSYPANMHEIAEARRARAGQFAVSNQPVHHIPFLYGFTSRPWRVGVVTRDALRRLFRGSAIGQGYPGDEDNGEMSAWYLFALSGLYPLQVGSSRYALFAPHLPLITWRLPGGALTIRSFGEGDIVQRVTVNGQEWQQSWIDHSALAGGCEISFWLGTQPSDWAACEASAAPSLTSWGELPRPWRDVSSAGTLASPGFAPLFDDDARTAISLAPGDEVLWQATAHETVEAYTVTLADPSIEDLAWRVEVRDQDDNWWVADRRAAERFDWPGQLRPFLLDAPVSTSALRLVVESGSLRCLQLEWLTR